MAIDTIKFKYAENGSPVLQRVSDDGSWVYKESEPVGYQGIATLVTWGKRYIGVGDYYSGSGLEPGAVYLVTKQEK